MNALLPIHPADALAWPWLPPMLRLRGVYQGPSGEVVRIHECGRAVVLGRNPRAWSVSYYPTSIVSAR